MAGVYIDQSCFCVLCVFLELLQKFLCFVLEKKTVDAGSVRQGSCQWCSIVTVQPFYPGQQVLMLPPTPSVRRRINGPNTKVIARDTQFNMQWPLTQKTKSFSRLLSTEFKQQQKNWFRVSFFHPQLWVFQRPENIVLEMNYEIKRLSKTEIRIGA